MSSPSGNRSQSLTHHAIMRADEMLARYHAIVSSLALRGEMPPATLIDNPHSLQEAMEDGLCDLRHLADSASISWEALQAEAHQSYEQERQENLLAARKN